jgi:hypothetical protein
LDFVSRLFALFSRLALWLSSSVFLSEKEVAAEKDIYIPQPWANENQLLPLKNIPKTKERTFFVGNLNDLKNQLFHQKLI